MKRFRTRWAGGGRDVPTDRESREHGVDPRTYLRDVLLRFGKVSDVRELTPYVWKQRWAPLVEAHRASIVERLMRKVDG